MRKLYPFYFVAVLAIVLVSCGRQNETPLLPNSQGARSGLPNDLNVSNATVTTSNLINGYLVEFDKRTVANNQTTFSYTVSGTGGPHALSHFALELPGCAPALDSFDPAGGTIGVNPLTGIFGIKWDISLDPSGSRGYSITFPGDVSLGVILATVKAADPVGIGEIAGPCAGFEISGHVFVDADSNSAFDPATESGIVDVTVTLVDGNGNTRTATTDASGAYAFLKSPGTYTVRVGTATPEDDFNEQLASSFDPTGPTSLGVTVGPDSPDNDFGFDPRAKEIINDLETGVLETNGRDVKFWKKQVRSALNDGKGHPVFNPTLIDSFITEIEALFLPEPFQFTPGNEVQEALDILSTRSKDPVLQLQKELLAAEFNEVAGIGLVGAAGLQSVLLSWAEALVAEGLGGAAPVSGAGVTLSGGSTTTLKDAQKLLKLLNGSTGGGGGGEG